MSETDSMMSNDSKKAQYAWGGAIVFAFVFTFIIWALGPLLEPFRSEFIVDQGASWYWWQQPTPVLTSQIIVWSFYLAHQFSIWACIYWAQKNLKDLAARPTTGLTKYNWATILLNLGFVVLHLIQTHIWFDGLAQDVPIWTSQGSVIIMLVFVLIIENPRRGLFLGKRAGKPITARVSGFVRRWHSYIIAWALVYTFWFHPMANDPQLVTGFFYMFLLFTQVSLAYTVVHIDKRWVVTLESFVAIHALFVALYNTLNPLIGSSDMWPMFFSGFAFMFVFTYMYAFDLKRWIRATVYAAYFALLVWIYLPSTLGGYGRELTYLMRMEFLWIPIILYLLAYVIGGIVYLVVRRKEK